MVVPAYNEAGNVDEVLRELPTFIDRVYVVDDGSTDDTWNEIRRCIDESVGDGANDRSTPTLPNDVASDRIAESIARGRVVACKHGENRGAGGAVKTGYLVALEDEVDVVATVDGDGQMDVGELPKLLEPIVEGRVEYAKGNRLRTAADRQGMPTFRLIGNVLLSGLTKVASGYWHVGDSQNGYTAIDAEALQRVDVESLYEYYGYCNELLVKLNTIDARVVDVPMPAIYGEESSSIDYSLYASKVSGMLLRNFVWRVGVAAGRSLRGSERGVSLVERFVDRRDPRDRTESERELPSLRTDSD
jgi:glycosyltransferase involved in cell wall biosynthesis